MEQVVCNGLGGECFTKNAPTTPTLGDYLVQPLRPVHEMIGWDVTKEHRGGFFLGFRTWYDRIRDRKDRINGNR